MVPATFFFWKTSRFFATIFHQVALAILAARKFIEFAINYNRRVFDQSIDTQLFSGSIRLVSTSRTVRLLSSPMAWTNIRELTHIYDRQVADCCISSFSTS